MEVLIKCCWCNISGTWFAGVVSAIAGNLEYVIVIYWSCTYDLFSTIPGISVTPPSGTAKSTISAIMKCSEILSKILIRCVTWQWACDSSFSCFRHFQCTTKTRADRARTKGTTCPEIPYRLWKLIERLVFGANTRFYSIFSIMLP